MRFRAVLIAFWTLILLWQLTRVINEEAAWTSLTIPVAAATGSILLCARGQTGYRLLFFPVFAVVFPFVVMGLFAVGVWLAGAPVPAMPSLMPSGFNLRRPVAGFALFLIVHWLAWVEIMDDPGDDILGNQ